MSGVNAAITGRYEPVGDPLQADCVIAHSFGTETGPGSVNHAIAQLAIEHTLLGRSLIVDRMLVDDVKVIGLEPDFIAEGPISDIKGGGLGTWGALLLIRAYMDEYELNKPLTVAQAFHASRVAAQSIKLGMEPILPPGLPRNFDFRSKQIWTKNRLLWIPCELVGEQLLRRRGQL